MLSYSDVDIVSSFFQMLECTHVYEWFWNGVIKHTINTIAGQQCLVLDLSSRCKKLVQCVHLKVKPIIFFIDRVNITSRQNKLCQIVQK